MVTGDIHFNLTITACCSKIFRGFWPSYSRPLCCQWRKQFQLSIGRKIEFKIVWLGQRRGAALPRLNINTCLTSRREHAASAAPNTERQRQKNRTVRRTCAPKPTGYVNTCTPTRARLKDKMLNRWLRAKQTFSFSLQLWVHMDPTGRGGQTNSSQSLWCASAGGRGGQGGLDVWG